MYSLKHQNQVKEKKRMRKPRDKLKYWLLTNSSPCSGILSELPLFTCNELCNHGSNIFIIYVSVSFLSCFMLTLTGHYGQFNFRIKGWCVNRFR